MIVEQDTLYDILDISSDASPEEIREAYLRAKSTYTKDNVALYSLISPAEREETLKRIEDSHTILSDPEQRRRYDSSHGLLSMNEFEEVLPTYDLPETKEVKRSTPPSSPISLDPNEDLLIPPTTDFLETPGTNSHDGFSTASPPRNASPTANPPPSPVKYAASSPFGRALRQPTLDPIVIHAIEVEKEWKGNFIKKIREAYRISLEEMAEITKISKTYLIALEEENFPKLPAPVFIRGFIVQVSRILKLPQEKVATAYMLRYHKSLNSG